MLNPPRWLPIAVTECFFPHIYWLVDKCLARINPHIYKSYREKKRNKIQNEGLVTSAHTIDDREVF